VLYREFDGSIRFPRDRSRGLVFTVKRNEERHRPSYGKENAAIKPGFQQGHVRALPILATEPSSVRWFSCNICPFNAVAADGDYIVVLQVYRPDCCVSVWCCSWDMTLYPSGPTGACAKIPSVGTSDLFPCSKPASSSATL